MDDFFNFCISYEYVTSIFIAFIIFGIWMPKRKYWYLSLGFGYLIMQVIWGLLQAFLVIIKPFDYLILFICFYFVVFLSFKLDIVKSLFLATVTYANQHIIHKITMIFVFLFGGSDIWMSWWYFLIYFIVESIINLALYFAYARRFKINNDFKINNLILVIITISILVMDIFLSFYTQERIFQLDNCSTLFIEFNLYGLILSLGGIVISFMNVQNNSLIEENAALELLFKKDEQRYKAAKQQAEQINIKVHDLKKMMKNQSLDFKDDDEETLDVIKNYESLYYTGNKALDLLLSEKKKICDKKEIELFLLIDGKQLNFMKSSHVYSLFNNLLDNAIEGVRDIQDHSLRYIKLKVSRIRDNVVISVENHTKNEIKFVSGLPITTKQDKTNHGFGVKSINAIVNKYKGHLKMDFKDNIFITKILFTYQEKISNETK